MNTVRYIIPWYITMNDVLILVDFKLFKPRFNRPSLSASRHL